MKPYIVWMSTWRVGYKAVCCGVLLTQYGIDTCYGVCPGCGSIADVISVKKVATRTITTRINCKRFFGLISGSKDKNEVEIKE